MCNTKLKSMNYFRVQDQVNSFSHKQNPRYSPPPLRQKKMYLTADNEKCQVTRAEAGPRVCYWCALPCKPLLRSLDRRRTFPVIHV